MANALTGINSTRISQLTLDALRNISIPFSAFTTDMSPDIATSGDTVVTRFVTNPVTQDFNSAKTVGNNNTTARSTYLYHYVGVSLGFTDREVSLSDVRLQEMFIRPALTALFNNVFANVAGLVIGSNFSQNTICNAANFSAANVANLATNLTTANVLQDNRHLIISPAMAKTLKTDTAVQASYAYGDPTAIRTGKVPRVYGFDVHEFNGAIPTNSENLIGWACAPQALLLATRQPAMPYNWAGQVVPITDPDSGLTLQYRNYYDGTTQRTELCLIYGAQIGVTGNLWRVLSS